MSRTAHIPAEGFAPERTVETLGRELAFEPVYSPQRAELLDQDPVEGYEVADFQIGNETLLVRHLKKLAAQPEYRYESHGLTVLWQKAGPNYMKKGTWTDLKKGYARQQAGLRTFTAQYYEGRNGSRGFVEVQEDSHQQYEARLATVCDEISEPITSDNTEFDPRYGKVVAAALRRAIRSPGNPNYFVPNEKSGLPQLGFDPGRQVGVVVPGLENQLWVAVRNNHRLHIDIALLAARIGHDARVYRNNGEYLSSPSSWGEGYSRSGFDRELVLVPITLELGNTMPDPQSVLTEQPTD